MFQGRLLAIGVAAAAGEPLETVAQIEAVAGQGLAGDRYALCRGAFQKGEILPSQQVTLIEREALDAVASDYKMPVAHLETRRNLLVEHVPLNHLVGRTFRVGPVLLRGVKLCEPCGYLEKITRPGIEKALRHRGGLRAEVVRGGTLRVGDEILREES